MSDTPQEEGVATIEDVLQLLIAAVAQQRQEINAIISTIEALTETPQGEE
jgi:hypothetical protein